MSVPVGVDWSVAGVDGWWVLSWTDPVTGRWERRFFSRVAAEDYGRRLVLDRPLPGRLF